MRSCWQGLCSSLPLLSLSWHRGPGPFGGSLAHMRHLHALIFHGRVWPGLVLGQLLLPFPVTQRSCWPMLLALQI